MTAGGVSVTKFRPNELGKKWVKLEDEKLQYFRNTALEYE